MSCCCCRPGPCEAGVDFVEERDDGFGLLMLLLLAAVAVTPGAGAALGLGAVMRDEAEELARSEAARDGCAFCEEVKGDQLYLRNHSKQTKERKEEGAVARWTTGCQLRKTHSLP